MSTGTRDRIMAALLSTATEKQAAEAAGVSPRTVRAYLADKEFSDEYEARRKALVKEATDQLQRALSSAVEAVRRIVTEGSNAEKLTACRTILEYGLRYTELYNIAARLDALEDAAKERTEDR